MTGPFFHLNKQTCFYHEGIQTAEFSNRWKTVPDSTKILNISGCRPCSWLACPTGSDFVTPGRLTCINYSSLAQSHRRTFPRPTNRLFLDFQGLAVDNTDKAILN